MKVVHPEPGWEDRVAAPDPASEPRTSVGNAFLEEGLIDEFRVLINPVGLGADRPLFLRGYERCGLKLTGVQPFDSGPVLLSYEP